MTKQTGAMDHHIDNANEDAAEQNAMAEAGKEDDSSSGSGSDDEDLQRHRRALPSSSLPASYVTAADHGVRPGDYYTAGEGRESPVPKQSDPDSDRRPADTYGALASRYKLTIYEKYYQYYRNIMDNRGRPMETWVCDSKYNGWWVRCQWHYQNRLGFMDVWLWVCDERANLTSTRVGHDYYDMADVLETILPYLKYDNLTTGLGSGFIDLGATVKPKTEDWYWDNEHHGWWVECWWEELYNSERIWIDPSSEYM